MVDANADTIGALIVALPESAGSAIYGLVDVFASTGTLWRAIVGDEPGRRLIRPKIVSLSRDPFRCGNGIPIAPDLTIEEKSDAGVRRRSKRSLFGAEGMAAPTLSGW